MRSKLEDMQADDVVLTPHQERKQLKRERKTSVKERELTIKQKRADKRRQFY